MLDEAEFAEVHALYCEALGSVKDVRERLQVPLSSVPTDECFRPVRDLYQSITGFAEPNQSRSSITDCPYTDRLALPAAGHCGLLRLSCVPLAGP